MILITLLQQCWKDLNKKCVFFKQMVGKELQQINLLKAYYRNFLVWAMWVSSGSRAYFCSPTMQFSTETLSWQNWQIYTDIWKDNVKRSNTDRSASKIWFLELMIMVLLVTSGIKMKLGPQVELAKVDQILSFA